MGITADVVRAWNTCPNGRYISSEMIQVLFGSSKRYEKKNITSILCKFVKKGYADKAPKIGYYIKIKDCEMPRRKVRATTSAETLDSLAIGKSILVYIDNLKNQIIEKQQRLNEEREVVKELIEKAKKMDILYQQAQAKIIELNAGKSKGLHLSELHEFREGLPKE